MLFGSARLQTLRISIQFLFARSLFKILESMLNISPTDCVLSEGHLLCLSGRGLKAPCTSCALHVKLIC
ncbi:hypothetical protein HYPSUDRAFT_45046 [Hypholoma sublateritium FD-334 SS-4]|uniref:Uncharacterized protein n=1 Tax=Hypholoma sublateritium (strain FD-334 SS-4) TaxID=945553 RepID=A0A0D2KVR5_HYPSF|nr:hypothetical protein HYPSUDRAFT_45046 [Hypholoma sublateritium FD-334 SS-4]